MGVRAPPGAALLHRADPRTGLTAADFTTLAEWFEQLNPDLLN
ncbi:hypothetical protein AB0F91_22225 [Amycolatopsis sp. NPDC023774]